MGFLCDARGQERCCWALNRRPPRCCWVHCQEISSATLHTYESWVDKQVYLWHHWLVLIWIQGFHEQEYSIWQRGMLEFYACNFWLLLFVVWNVLIALHCSSWCHWLQDNIRGVGHWAMWKKLGEVKNIKSGNWSHMSGEATEKWAMLYSSALMAENRIKREVAEKMDTDSCSNTQFGDEDMK